MGRFFHIFAVLNPHSEAKATLSLWRGMETTNKPRVPGRRGRASTAQAGFTLLELLIVMVLVGVLFGIAANSLAPQRSRISLNTAAQQLSQDILAARSRAMSSGNQFRVLLKAGSIYTLDQSADGGGTWVTTLTRTLPSTITFAKGAANDKVTCDTRGFCLPSIGGQVAGQTSEFQLTSSSTTIRIVFAMVGTTRVVKL